jgi:hypothetical protein
MAEFTVTEALVRLKLTKKKIEDAKGRLMLGLVATKDKVPLPVGYKTEEEFKKECNARMDQIRGLMRFKKNLKDALVKSNAATQVNVGSSTMTVAEAIERKNSIKDDKELLQSLRLGWNQISTAMERENNSVEPKADKFIQETFGKAEGSNHQEALAMRSKFIENNKPRFVGLDNAESLIKKLEEEIYEFESNVDVALSVKNSSTLVTVPE